MSFSIQNLSPKLTTYLHSSDLTELPSTLDLAGSAGSDRKYYRIHGSSHNWILMVSPLDLDFDRFIQITQYLLKHNFKVPQIFEMDMENGQMLLEDLGAEPILDLVQQGASLTSFYPQIIQSLVDFQHIAQVEILSSIKEREFGMEDLLWESQYFTDHFLGQYLGYDLSRREVLKPFFRDFAERVNAQNKTLMHRDFQSQNLMWHKSQIYWIDYQGARYGSEFYDLASLLFDPYTCLESEAIQEYFKFFCQLKSIDPEQNWEVFLYAATQRIMQACGAYANLSFNKGKENYRQYLEPGRAQLNRILKFLKKETFF